MFIFFQICKLSIPYFNDVNGDEDQDGIVLYLFNFSTLDLIFLDIFITDTFFFVQGQKEQNLAVAMKKLGNLVKSLRQVKSLHYEYNCKLSLAQFTAVSKSIFFFFRTYNMKTVLKQPIICAY